MQRITFLALAVLSLIPIAGSPQGTEDPLRAEVDVLTAQHRPEAMPRDGVLFVGSSSMRLWTSLANDFPGVPVLNVGFGGSAIADSTRFADRIITPYRPRLVVLYAGDNDIAAGRTPEQVISDFQAFATHVRQALPHVAIAFVSIKPSVARKALWPQMQIANAGIERWSKQHKDIVYVDVASMMLDANGTPRAELLREDGLHMGPAGYAIWIAALKPVLARFGFAVR